MNLSQIPLELKQLNQWVCCWNGSKVPMQATRRKAASSTAPETWSSFDRAVWAVEKGHYDYIGFVFNDNGIVGIDLDAGFQDGLLTPQAANIISRCSSYTEKSRSGRGVHILLYGSLPFSGKNNLDGVEIYQSRRYFIMTGEQLLFSEIAENQDAIDWILDKFFSDGVKSPQNRSKQSVKIYTPEYEKPRRGQIRLSPVYPEIKPGCRNISLTSLAGSMHTTGYTKQQIYRELCKVNQRCCKPPLSIREVQNITDSITRYRR